MARLAPIVGLACRTLRSADAATVGANAVTVANRLYDAPNTWRNRGLDLERLFIGAFGAVVGVVGWLFVGLYIQGKAKDRAAREAARAVYFELASNHLNVFVGLEYGSFGPLSRVTFERLLPELAAWLPIEDLQAISVAYMGQAGYEQASRATEIPAAVRRQSLLAIHEAHRTAVALLRTRAFKPSEVARLAEHLRPDQLRLMDAADDGPVAGVERERAATRA